MKIRPDNLPVTPFGSVMETDVETALEADEALTFDAADDGANLTPTLVDNVGHGLNFYVKMILNFHFL